MPRRRRVPRVPGNSGFACYGRAANELLIGMLGTVIAGRVSSRARAGVAGRGGARGGLRGPPARQPHRAAGHSSRPRECSMSCLPCCAALPACDVAALACAAIPAPTEAIRRDLTHALRCVVAQHSGASLRAFAKQQLAAKRLVVAGVGVEHARLAQAAQQVSLPGSVLFFSGSFSCFFLCRAVCRCCDYWMRIATCVLRPASCALRPASCVLLPASSRPLELTVPLSCCACTAVHHAGG